MPRSKKAINTKRQLPLTDKIFLTLNIIAAAMLLLSYLAPGTDPREMSLIAVLGFGYQFLILANVAFIIYWLIRKKVFSLISLFSILAGGYFLYINFGFRAASPVANKELPSDIRVMTYNVHEFMGKDRFEGPEVQTNILQIIKTKQPDIISLVEYSSKKGTKDQFMQSLYSLNYKYHFYKPFDRSQGDSTGIAIFSKYPIIKADTVASPDILNTKAIYVDVKHFAQTFRFYSVHLAAVALSGGQKSKILNGGGVSIDKTSFIKNKLVAAFVKRSYQVSQINKSIEKCQYPYIIAGDFNDTPNSFAVNNLGNNMKSAFAEKGSGLVSTYYSTFPILQIDHILVSPQFDVANYEVIDKKLSDHKPVIADVQLN